VSVFLRVGECVYVYMCARECMLIPGAVKHDAARRVRLHATSQQKQIIRSLVQYCVRESMCACARACARASVCVRSCVRVRIRCCVCVYMCGRVSVLLFVCLCICVSVFTVWVHMSLCTHLYVRPAFLYIPAPAVAIAPAGYAFFLLNRPFSREPPLDFALQ